MTPGAPLLAIAWLTPLTGIVVASALLPLLLALYFLKLRRRPASIPSTLLWKRSVEDMRANTPFQRLRPSLLLLLQILLLGFVAFALMQPRMDLGVGGGGRTVILIDRSGSMNATDLDPKRTRLDVAKEQAKERIEKLFEGGIFSSSTGEAMVIAFGDSAEVLQPFTRSKADALRAIERVEPTDGGTRLREALALARAFTTVVNPDSPGAAPAKGAALELWSDGRIADLGDEALRPGEELVYHVVGRADAGNAGIEGIAAERSATEPGLIQVFVTVRNDSAEPIESDLEMLVDGQRRGVSAKPVKVAASAEATAEGRRVYRPGYERYTFPAIVQPRAGVLGVRLVRGDALPTDNLAEIAVSAPRRLRVALVGTLDFAVRDVVSALPLEKAETLTGEEFAARTRSGEQWDVVVAAAGALPSPVPPGRYLIFGVPAGVDGLNPYAVKERVSVRSERAEHPLLRAVNLDDLYVAKATAVAPNSETEALVEGAETPLVLLARRGPVAAVVTTFEPIDSNWPFQRGFVTFVANAVEWLGSMDQVAAQEEHHPGDVLTARVPAGVREAQLRLPDGSSVTVPARDGTVAYGPVVRAGAYELRWTEERGEQRRAYAVNPADGEGRIAAADAVGIGAQKIAGTVGSAMALSDLWPYALAASLVLLLIEWWVYHRRHWVRRRAGAAASASGGGLPGAPIIKA
ncbi:MAG: VWA domain-containing protein [Phycisphaerales bacterium]